MTQEEWEAEADRLEAPGERLTIDMGGYSMCIVEGGMTMPVNCDALTRWVLHRVGLEPYGINAPPWSCSWRGTSEGMVFAYWSLGVDYVGVYLTDPDLEERPPREDGRPRPSQKGQWDRCFVIPTMPILPEDPKPDGFEDWSHDDRKAWMRERRGRKKLLMALALVHFAGWLLVNPNPAPLSIGN